MKLELKSTRGTLHLLGVERGAPHFSAQAAVATAPMPRGEVFRVVDKDNSAWRYVTVTLLMSLPAGWSQSGCDPAEKDFTHLDFLIPLQVKKEG